MSVLVAVASEDGVNVDQHFGWARELLIYKVEDDGAYELIEDADILMVHFCPVSSKLLAKAKHLKLIMILHMI